MGKFLYFSVTKPSGATLWEHRRVAKGCISEHIPYASRHFFVGTDGRKADVTSLPQAIGEVVTCIVRTCRDMCAPDDATPSVDYGEGLATCPSDRWCAGLDPSVKTWGEQSSSKRSRVTLSLEASLQNGDDPITTQLPGPKAFKHQMSSYHLPSILSPLPDGVKLKLSSAKAIWGDNQCDEPQCLELYIDGSSSKQGSGWAVVAVATDWSGARSFIGCAAGPTVIDTGNANWVGVVSEDNIAAEVSAMVAAQVAAIVSHLPTIIRPDLQFSRHLVQGTQTSAKIGPVVEVIDCLAT